MMLMMMMSINEFNLYKVSTKNTKKIDYIVSLEEEEKKRGTFTEKANESMLRKKRGAEASEKLFSLYLHNHTHNIYFFANNHNIT